MHTKWREWCLFSMDLIKSDPYLPLQKNYWINSYFMKYHIINKYFYFLNTSRFSKKQIKRTHAHTQKKRRSSSKRNIFIIPKEGIFMDLNKVWSPATTGEELWDGHKASGDDSGIPPYIKYYSKRCLIMIIIMVSHVTCGSNFLSCNKNF